MAIKKPKPKPPVPGRPKPTPAKKKPAEKRVSVTSVTPGITVKKPSAKQVAGTRKVVGALASVTPIGKAAKVATFVSRKVRMKNFTRNQVKQSEKNLRLRTSTGPKQPNYPSGLVSVKPKAGIEYAKKKGLETRGYKQPVKNRVTEITPNPNWKNLRDNQVKFNRNRAELLTGKKLPKDRPSTPGITPTIKEYKQVAKAKKAISKADKRALKAVNTKKYTKKK